MFKMPQRPVYITADTWWRWQCQFTEKTNQSQDIKARWLDASADFSDGKQGNT